MFKAILTTGLLAGALSCQAGLITVATARVDGQGISQVCDSGSVAQSTSTCVASIGNTAAAYSLATASYGSVTAYVQGGANGRGDESRATALGSFSDTLTIFGGTGTGQLVIGESTLFQGTGSLGSLNQSIFPQRSIVDLSFTYGTPFALSLSAMASGNFDGSLCDGGSLLVQKSIQSMTVEGSGTSNISFTDTSGFGYSISAGGVKQASFTSAPEGDSWVFGAIGAALLWIASRRLKTQKPQD